MGWFRQSNSKGPPAWVYIDGEFVSVRPFVLVKSDDHYGGA
jgi:hypothetical protein